MPNEIIDYSTLMNDKKFRVYLPDYYSPQLPKYFTGLRPPNPMLNGVEVSAEEYNNHQGITEYANDEIIRHAPLQVGSEYDMTVSMVSPAGIVDLCINEVPFTIVELDDIEKILEIMWKYKDQIEPYMDRNNMVKVYSQNLSQAIHLLMNNQDQRIKAAKLAARAKGEQEGKPVSLSDMLGACF